MQNMRNKNKTSTELSNYDADWVLLLLAKQLFFQDQSKGWFPQNTKKM